MSTTIISKKIKSVKCNRECSQINSEVKLKMLFTDSCGKPTDPSSLTVTLKNPAGGDVNPNVPAVKIDVGYWYIPYTPATAGVWKDVWSVQLLGEAITFEGDFTVISGGSVAQPACGLEFNSLIVIELDESIADADGKTLGEDKFLSFSTEYNPYYASTHMLRMEMGSWANLVPDDTIALAIHWSSLEADNITCTTQVTEKYFYARTRFVMYDAAIKLFSMPMGASAGSGKQKQLGDLMIESGASVDFNLKDLVEELKAERDEWWRVVNAGGSIVLGQGLGPSYASKGSKIDTPRRSREWHDPWREHYAQPTQNSLYKRSGQTKHKHGYTGWNEYYFTSIKKGVRRGRS